jgi:LmbE family N-acetylglucosaminyl deacetylase
VSDTAVTSEPITRALVITAHPDDVDFGAGGTVAVLTASGVEVSYCIVTDGDAGGFDRTIDRKEMAVIRRKEQRRAAEILGVHDVTFLGYPDGRVTASLDLRRDLAREIRRSRPDRVICPSPERDYERLPASHPDHLAVGEAALDALYPDARNPFAFPELLDEGFEPHTVHEIWIMASSRSTIYVDITETVDRKLAALAAHESQLPEPEGTAALVRGWAERIGAEAGYPEGHLAEGFLQATVF